MIWVLSHAKASFSYNTRHLTPAQPASRPELYLHPCASQARAASNVQRRNGGSLLARYATVSGCIFGGFREKSLESGSCGGVVPGQPGHPVECQGHVVFREAVWDLVSGNRQGQQPWALRKQAGHTTASDKRSSTCAERALVNQARIRGLGHA
jgi:hypothetical protein